MYNAETDHQVVPIGADLMHLLDNQDGAVIAAAARTSKGRWQVSADGADTVTVNDRTAAVTALTETALAVLGGTGYSTMVPHGLTAQP
ncbi:hypothetical protein [Mycolicibacter minnesotensis]